MARAVCPVCSAVSAAADLSRCDRCGFLFVASRSGEPASRVPEPPSVVYTTSAPNSAPEAIRPAHTGSGLEHGRAAGGHGAYPRLNGDAPNGDAPNGDAPNGDAPGGDAPDGNEMERAVRSLGPPPPYRPFASPSRPRPPRDEMAPEAAAVPLTLPPVTPVAVNIRASGALGPPPPYRPIVRGAPVFGRGPPPDLEPWRLASWTRVPAAGSNEADARPDGADRKPDEWSLIREPESLDATPHRIEEVRLEAGEFSGPEDLPVAWHAGMPAYVAPASRRLPRRGTRGGSRVTRPVPWALGIVVCVVVLGIALHAERAVVMGALPPAARIYVSRIYAALGLAGRSAASDTPVTAGCAAGQAPGCPDRQPEPTAK